MNKIILIHSAYLPGGTVGVDVTIKPLKRDELNERCVLLVKEYEVLNPCIYINGNKIDKI